MCAHRVVHACLISFAVFNVYVYPGCCENSIRRNASIVDRAYFGMCSSKSTISQNLGNDEIKSIFFQLNVGSWKLEVHRLSHGTESGTQIHTRYDEYTYCSVWTLEICKNNFCEIFKSSVKCACAGTAVIAYLACGPFPFHRMPLCMIHLRAGELICSLTYAVAGEQKYVSPLLPFCFCPSRLHPAEWIVVWQVVVVPSFLISGQMWAKKTLLH